MVKYYFVYSRVKLFNVKSQPIPRTELQLLYLLDHKPRYSLNILPIGCPACLSAALKLKERPFISISDKKKVVTDPFKISYLSFLLVKWACPVHTLALYLPYQTEKHAHLSNRLFQAKLHQTFV